MIGTLEVHHPLCNMTILFLDCSRDDLHETGLKRSSPDNLLTNQLMVQSRCRGVEWLTHGLDDSWTLEMANF